MAAGTWLFFLLATGEPSGFAQPVRLPEAPQMQHVASDGPHRARPASAQIVATEWRLRPSSPPLPEANPGRRETAGFTAVPAAERRPPLQAATGSATASPPGAIPHAAAPTDVRLAGHGRGVEDEVAVVALPQRFKSDTNGTSYKARIEDGHFAGHVGGLGAFPMLPGAQRLALAGSFTRSLSASTGPGPIARSGRREADVPVDVPPGFGAPLRPALGRKAEADPPWSRAVLDAVLSASTMSLAGNDDRSPHRRETELPAATGPPVPESGQVEPTRLAETRDAGDELDRPRSARSDDAEIVVTGRRLRPAILDDVTPEIELGPQDITGFGAGTVGEVLDQLAPQTTGAGPPNARPLVLINGQRTSGIDEVRSLPPEAILRIEILPEYVALRYGRRPGSKVVNLVLQPNFKAITTETSYGAATEGGRSLAQARVNVARIAPIGRWSLDALYVHESALTEDERPLTGDLGPFRTLLPETQRLALGGSFTRNLSASNDLNINARVEQRDSESRLGPVPAGSSAGSSPALRRNATTRSASLGATLTGAVDAWHWSATASYDLGRQRIETELPAAAGPPIASLVRSTTQRADLDLLAYGELATLPAGPISISLGGRFEVLDYSNRSSLALVPGPVDLSRRTASAQVNFEIPLLDGSTEGQTGFGEVSANLNLNIEHVSGFGTLKAIGGGLRWTPARWMSLNLSASTRESAPDPQSLRSPVVLFPNVRTFDFARGETVDILRIDGGNPDLRAQDLSSFSANLSLRPLPARNLLVSASYTRTRASDPVGALSVALPEFEAAFPRRFARDADGRLVSIDARPVNFVRTERDELRWGVSFFRNFTPATPRAAEQPGATEPQGAEAARAAGFDLNQIRRAPANPATLQLGLYHSWRLRDRLRIRDGIPAIDFLEGSPAGLQGGSPRHRLELQASVYRAGLGARLTGSWQSGTRVRVQDRTLSYDSLARFDLRLFADLGEQQALVSRAPWLRGARVSLEVENVLNARPRVRDETGLTPLGLQPSYLDPAGRSVRIVLRKLF